jgi:hypothetical protein
VRGIQFLIQCIGVTRAFLTTNCNSPINVLDIYWPSLKILHSSGAVTRLTELGGCRFMPNAHQIRERLADWINGKTSLIEFEDWFIPATWNIHQSGDKDAENMVDEIELNLSEYSGGYISQIELRDAMRSLLADTSTTLVIKWARPDSFRLPALGLLAVGAATQLSRLPSV